MSEADLRAVDPEVPRIVANEKLVVEGPEGLIRRAIEEAAKELLTALENYGSVLGSSEIPAGHLAAVLGTGGDTYSVRAQLHQVVVSDPRPGYWSPIKQWVVRLALAKVYTAAANLTATDRYQKKYENLVSDIELRHQTFMYNVGVPVILSPLEAPGALASPDAGSWTRDNLSAITQTGAGSTTIYVALTYTGANYISQATRGNAESGPSQCYDITLALDKTVRISIASLTPPTATIPPGLQQYGAGTRMAATGWNVWVGTTPGGLYLQNAAPLAVATKTYDLPWPIKTASDSVAIHAGQTPDQWMLVQRFFRRG